jgi:hypothetical protein
MTMKNSTSPKTPKQTNTQQTRQAVEPDDTLLPGFRLTERDIAICELLLVYRELTTAQIETLLFSPSTRSKCKRRVQLLSAAGFLGRTKNVLSEHKQYVYWLEKPGAQLLADRQGISLSELDWKPTDQTLRPYFRDHLLATNDVRIAITLAATKLGYTIEEWRDDATLKRAHNSDKVTIPTPHGGTEQVAIQPDGYFVLNTGTKRLKRFVEIDRQTITLDTWARRVRGYIAYFHSEAYEKRYGSKAGGVLTITIGEQRAANMKATTEHAGGKARFWFTTFAAVSAATILTDAIWAKASADGRFALIDPAFER